MRKTIQDVAGFLKEIMVPGTDEAYAIDPAYANLSTDPHIREGIRAFRAFLDRLYDTVIAEGGAYDQTKKVAHEYENRIGLSVYYPFLHNISTLLLRMGYRGALAEDAQSLTCDSTLFSDKLSVAKNLECLRFLIKCGIRVSGIDANDKKQNLTAVKAIGITYPENPAMLTGLKVMATAEIEHGSLINQDILLRCDYRAIQKDAPDPLTLLRDTIRYLSADVQAFVLQLHQRYLDQGLAPVVEIKGFHIYIRYCYKRKDVWGVNASLSNGCHINVKATKMDEYADVVKTFPPVLRQLIAKGYGCGRKRAIGRCDGGCRGMPIPLDDSVLDLRAGIVTWFDQEIRCLKGK